MPINILSKFISKTLIFSMLLFLLSEMNEMKCAFQKCNGLQKWKSLVHLSMLWFAQTYNLISFIFPGMLQNNYASKGSLVIYGSAF